VPLQEGRNFYFETVFSHPSKIDFVAHAKALGYQIILVFIHLEPTALNKARVKQRTEEGGHTVPEDKIENRIPPCGLTITIAPNAEGGVGASKNGKNGAKTCQAFILFFSGTLCC
jgi:hypothetical protein